MLSYRIDEASPDEVQDDPFGGHGLFLAMDAPAAEILAALEAAAGEVLPAVAFEGSGAWLDARNLGHGQVTAIMTGWPGNQVAADDRG